MDSDEKKTAFVTFRAPPSLVDKIDEEAKKERRHRGELVRHLVEDALDEREREREDDED